MADRKKQIKAITSKLEPVVWELDELISDLETALDNMPEAFRYGDRGEAAENRIDKLRDWQESLNEMIDDEEIN